MSSTLLKRSLFAAAATVVTGSAIYYASSQRAPRARNKKMLSTYEATFSVPITCESCTNDISRALSRLPGIQETSFSIPSKLLTTKGTEPPSNIVAAIQSTGREPILRGSGSANSAAVCILETPPSAELPTLSHFSPVRGLVRLIELGEKLTMLDLTLTGMDKGKYQASVRANGDISAGKKSMGNIFTGVEGDKQGTIGELTIDEKGRGSLVGEIDWRVWEMVGRGLVVERIKDSDVTTKQRGDELVVGVIARSAGIWENDKTICSCLERPCGKKESKWFKEVCFEFDAKRAPEKRKDDIELHQVIGVLTASSVLYWLFFAWSMRLSLRIINGGDFNHPSP